MEENKINSKINLFSNVILNVLKLQLDKLENSYNENLDKFKSNGTGMIKGGNKKRRKVRRRTV